MKDEFENIDWSLTTWEGSRREQLRRWSDLSFDEILAAQEEMENLAAEFADSPNSKLLPPAVAV